MSFFGDVPKISTIIFLVLYPIWCSPTPVNPENLQHVRYINDSIDYAVNPCDNFYDYACGNWPMQHWGHDYVNFTTFLQHNYEEVIENLILHKYAQKDAIKKHQQSVIGKAVTYYYSCKNRKDFSYLRYFDIVKPAKDVEWPLMQERTDQTPVNTNVSAAMQEQYNVFHSLGQLFSYGLNNVILNITVSRLTNGSLAFELQTPQSQDLAQHYIDDFLNLFELSDQQSFKYYKDIKETHNYWQSMYRVYKDVHPFVMTFNQLRRLYPDIAKFLKLILPPLEVRNDDVVHVKNLKYVRFLLRKHWKSAEYEKLCNYLMVQFYRHLQHNHIPLCSSALQRRMQLAVNFMYNQDVMLPQAFKIIASLNQILQRMYKHLTLILDENNLHLSAQQLQFIKNKILNLNINIGNMPDHVEMSAVQDLYRHVPDLDINNFEKNDLWLLKHTIWESINCPPDMKCGSNVPAALTNYVDENLIIITFAALSPPLHHVNFDALFSVSLLGTLIAYEYARSIDPMALRTYTSFKNVTTQNRFIKSLECLRLQNSTDISGDHMMQSLDILGERVLDSLAAQTAYRAYDMDYEERPEFSKIPWQQLFFLNLSQLFCRLNSDSAKAYQRNTARLNGVAMNMPEFAEAFQCPKGSRMYPEERCRFY